MLSEMERRREFAIVLGTALAVMLVTILTHIFDPAPDALALPWTFFGELAIAILAGVGAGAAAVLISLRRADLSRTLREG